MARSHRLAQITIASVEGAVVLCRAHHDTRPLGDVERELSTLIRSAANDAAA